MPILFQLFFDCRFYCGVTMPQIINTDTGSKDYIRFSCYIFDDHTFCTLYSKTKTTIRWKLSQHSSTPLCTITIYARRLFLDGKLQFLQVFFHLSFRILCHSQSSLPAHFLAALSLLPSLSGSCHHKSFHLPSWCRFPLL